MAGNVKVAISADFLTAFAKLQRSTQGKVTEFINKFRNDPTSPGINYEKISYAADKKIYSVRIDDTYRGIVVREEETGVYLLLWVDHHDEAYTWAARKRCEVNPKTGAVQIFDVQTSEESLSSQLQKALFDSISDDQLLELGVPEAQLTFVKRLSDEKALIAAKDALPQDVFEYLSWLAEDIPIDEVLEYAREERAGQTASSISEALETPVSLKSFVVVEGEDELRRIMAEPLEKWRAFLHPTQGKIVKRD